MKTHFIMQKRLVGRRHILLPVPGARALNKQALFFLLSPNRVLGRWCGLSARSCNHCKSATLALPQSGGQGTATIPSYEVSKPFILCPSLLSVSVGRPFLLWRQLRTHCVARTVVYMHIYISLSHCAATVRRRIIEPFPPTNKRNDLFPLSKEIYKKL